MYKHIENIADQVPKDGGEDSGMDDENSTEAIFRLADARDYHIAHTIESLNQELARPPTPTLGGCIILPDILSRSPTRLAPYQPEPMLGSRAPTPTSEADPPRAETPLFMPISEDEDDTDRSDTTCTTKPGARRAPSLHQSSRPTAKRRRVEPPEDKSLKAYAKTFLDLEAEDDTDEEDDGDDDGVPMADFIDDNPVDDEPIDVDDDDGEDGFTSQSSEVERAEALAAHFDENARRNRPGVEKNIDSSPHDVVSRLPHTSDPDLHRFSVPRGSQLQLLEYLHRCSGVKSVFFRERGAGGRNRPRFETVAVYVETDNLVDLERAMAKYVGGYAMLSLKPVPIDVEDRVSTLNMSPITSLVGRWARVRSGSSLYQGDLVFVQNESDYLVVPRVVYERLSQTPDRPPARLFDGDECVAAGNEVQKRNHRWLWHRRWFIYGLEQRSYVPSQLTVEGVVPTVDEQQWARFDQHRALFNGSSHPALVAPLIGRCCALQEGDRIVVVSGKHSGKTGYIVALTNTWLRDVNTQRQHLVHLAAVLENYDGTTAIDRSSLQMAGNHALFIPISALRLHALGIVRSLLVGDRVVAVGGAAQGLSGWIENVNEHGLVTFRPSPPIENADATMELEMGDVRREFRVGDVAEVNRSFLNVPKGTVGFITEVCPGGFVHLHQRPLPQLLSVMKAKPQNDIETVLVAAPSSSSETLQIATVQKTPTELISEWKNEQADPQVVHDHLIHVPTTHLNFTLFDDNGLAVHSSVSPNVREELDEKRREWEKMKMSTGRAYIGCEVMIAGKLGHKKLGAYSFARKGLFGTVIGYTFKQSTKSRLTKGREKRLKDGKTSAGADVRLRIRYEGSMEEENANLDQVVERYSKQPLEHVLYLRGMHEIMANQTQAPKKGSEEERFDDRPLLPPSQGWYETSREPEPLGHIYGPPRDIGEATGHWLQPKELVCKRIDIKIEGVVGCLKQVIGYEGKRGFVKLAHPLSVQDIEKKLLECRTVPMHHPAKVPPVSIKPYRLSEPDSSGTAHCISSVVGRVIIIGPNIHGVTDRVGQYAETVPSAPAHAPLPTPIVEVRFALTPSGERPPNEEYHLESLCRALNVALNAHDLPATDFDAVPPK
ncbi:hypothetical protein DFH06DRAFT_1321204 [Mycena polygramma]|nr:hypothetical protein DFH06DRAFT_1321204 [Mycena polygramma]